MKTSPETQRLFLCSLMFKQSQDCTATNPRTVELSFPTEQNAEIVLSAWISLYIYFNKKYSKAFVPC